MSTTTFPTAFSIIQTTPLPSNLQDKSIVITGPSSGIGLEIVRAFASTNATLYLLSRDPTQTEHILTEAGIYNPSHMHLIRVDLSDLKSVRTAASSILAQTEKLHVLINNAGLMALPNLTLTKEEGYEMQFTVNYLSHFLLFNLLKNALVSGSSAEFQSRVINVSASGHRIHGLNDANNYHFQNGGYHPWTSYAQSKTAGIYMANEIERRYSGQGIHACSIHPGLVDTSLGRHLPVEHVNAMLADESVRRVLRSPGEGAAGVVWAAVSGDCEGIGGRYLVDCKVAEWDGEGGRMSNGYCAHTYDEEREGRLWRDSLGMVGLEGEGED